MTDKEFDKLIEQEAAELNDRITREERLYELEQKVIKQAELIELHFLEKKRWDFILAMAGAETRINPQTFAYEDSSELIQSDIFVEFTTKELGRLARLGLDFDSILKGIAANETLSAQWEQMLMTMKLYHTEEPKDV